VPGVCGHVEESRLAQSFLVVHTERWRQPL
jgi:hypothetical protein